VESPTNTLDQVEERILGLKNKVDEIEHCNSDEEKKL
jgi:hypothetical protein